MSNRAGLLMMAVVLVSCVPSRPIHYYTLAPTAGSTAAENADGPTMLVAHLEAPESLQDERIRYRAGTHEVGAYEFHRWTERPGAMVRDALVRALRASGKYRRVMESSSQASGDYVVRGKIQEFDEVDNPAIATRIALHLELIDNKNNREVWDRQYEREEPAGGKTMEEVVQSMDRNLQQVVGAATADIAAAVSNHRP